MKYDIEMRRVKVFKQDRVKADKYHRYIKVSDGEAYFHKWGIDYTELNDGVGSCSAAIIERDDGRIELIYPDNIQFIKKSTILPTEEKECDDQPFDIFRREIDKQIKSLEGFMTRSERKGDQTIEALKNLKFAVERTVDEINNQNINNSED